MPGTLLLFAVAVLAGNGALSLGQTLALAYFGGLLGDALSYAIAMDIHPICNTHVVAHVVEITGRPQSREAWMQHFIGQGLANVERLLAGRSGRFAFGDRPTMADFCIVPQLYNARRWGVDISACPHLLAIDAECAGLPAFEAAFPRE